MPRVWSGSRRDGLCCSQTLEEALTSFFQVNHLRCLHEFVKSQTTYYAQCYRHMLDLQKQLGRCGWTQVSEAPYLLDPVSGLTLLAKGLLFRAQKTHGT